jgi:hypothetical protein
MTLVPLLRPPAGAPARPAYSETFFPEERRDAGDYPGLTPLASVRIAAGAGISKVIWQLGGDRVDFYDLAADPNERSATPMIGEP